MLRMQWFVSEQVEEEAIVRDIVSDLARVLKARTVCSC
jgi:ferritin